MLTSINRALFPKIQELQKQYEALKATLAPKFSKKLIDKVCYEHMQAAKEKDKAVLFPSDAAVAYYENLLCPGKLEEVLYEGLRTQLAQSLKGAHLEEEQVTKAKDLIQKMSYPELLENAKPGVLMTILFEEKSKSKRKETSYDTETEEPQIKTKDPKVNTEELKINTKDPKVHSGESKKRKRSLATKP
jgi:hypothetical protein